MTIPRCEHPKPQFERADWINLNGEWDFCIDNGRSGRDREFYKHTEEINGKITVPFCPESPLSGVGHKDFMYGVWYRKSFVLDEAHQDKRVVLHIGAADYLTRVYINGSEAGSHAGGYVSFAFDITKYLVRGENEIVIYCEDDTRDGMKPSGKQCTNYYSCGCSYTRTTGIWQTVWIEFTEKEYIASFRCYPDYRKSAVNLSVKLSGTKPFAAVAYYEGREVGRVEYASASGTVDAVLPLSETHLWEVGCGRLYDLELTFGDDTVKSYFGLRNMWFDGHKFMLNGKSVFQRLVLDQGFYPDGIYTAPTDDALLNDIKLSKAAGFNGARLHEKVFEERFLYHADKEGYLVWGEYPNWGLDHTKPEAVYSILPEWLEEIERDFNHPAIIGWCPFNETWDINHARQFDPLLAIVYRATKAADTTRPCIDTSGNYHVVTDLYDVHDYNQDPVSFKEKFDVLLKGEAPAESWEDRQRYTGGAYFVSEYGGIKWSPVEGNDHKVAWGYGNAPQSPEEYMARYKGLTDALLDNEKICAFCYTQLTDVEQEQNGVYTYERKEKFPAEFFFSVNARKAAIED